MDLTTSRKTLDSDRRQTQSAAQSSGKGVTAWTPGPWKWNEHGYCWLEGADGSSIFHVDDYDNVCPHRNDSNARLISASPDLYEALKAVITHPAVVEVLAPEDSLGSVKTLAAAALWKAEGK